MAPTCCGSKLSIRFSICSTAFWTMSSVSCDPRAYDGRRPCAHRFSGGRHRCSSAPAAASSPARIRTRSSIVESGLWSVGSSFSLSSLDTFRVVAVYSLAHPPPLKLRRTTVASAKVVRAAARDGGFMDAIWQDLRFGFRVLITHRQFTIAAVVVLAFGIGATTAVFSVVNAVLLRPLP